MLQLRKPEQGRTEATVMLKTQLTVHPRLSETGCKEAEDAHCLLLLKAMLIEKGLSLGCLLF